MLRWPINTRAALQDGLYRYDAIARLRDVAAASQPCGRARSASRRATTCTRRPLPPARPAGHGAAAVARPRVLLIDEIDKSDIDLPNDLLHVFEEGEFEIPELARLLPKRDDIRDTEQVVEVFVQTEDEQMRAIPNGVVRCSRFPVVVLTSNGERDFPPAFLRRCLRLEMRPPDKRELEVIVKNHLGDDLFAKAEQQINGYIADFVVDRDQRKKGNLATDQLLNLVYMTTRDLVDDQLDLPEDVREKLKQELPVH